MVDKTVIRKMRGVTLPEMMVAVAITVGMLAIIGMVFKSSTDASGKALANNEMMQQVRALTLQLESDLRGLRPDMPMAIIFEEDADGIRGDRIWFFANGDFQTTDYGSTDTISGNVAHIFYGQAEDSPVTPGDLGGPQRQFLTRRARLLTVDTSLNWSTKYYPTIANPEDYDYLPISWSSLVDWKNEPFLKYTNPVVGHFQDISSVVPSLIRRPNLSNISTIGDDGLQRLYLLPDVTDFKVELWFETSSQWFPNPTDIVVMNQVFQGQNKPQIAGYPFAFYWNIPNGARWLSPPPMSIDWRDINGDIAGMWPRAIRFTFTLYDKHRRHWPEGRTFSYIVKVPQR